MLGVALFTIVVGVGIAFFGRLLFKTAAYILGAATGVLIGLGLGAIFGLPHLLTIGMAALLGAIGAFLSYYFAKALLGLYLSFLSGVLLYYLLGYLAPGQPWYVHSAGAIVGSAIVLWFIFGHFETLMAMVTACLGGAMAGYGTASALGLEEFRVLFVAVALVLLGVLGSLFQLRDRKGATSHARRRTGERNERRKGGSRDGRGRAW